MRELVAAAAAAAAAAAVAGLSSDTGRSLPHCPPQLSFQQRGKERGQHEISKPQ